MADEADNVPFLSVAIGVWNREDTVKRCLDSIVSQDFPDFEIVAVDDGSTDASMQVLESYGDPRLIVRRHETNRGHHSAYQTAVDHSRGSWIIVFGSDDELYPGALRKLSEMAREAPADVGIVGMCYHVDDGSVAPRPPFPPGDVRLGEWLKWLGEADEIDFIMCFRRTVLEVVPFPSDGRGSLQMFTRIAARWSIRVDSSPGGLIHTDSANRLTHGRVLRFSRERKLAHAIESAEILDEFGVDLKTHAPGLRWAFTYQAGWWYMLAGERAMGARYLLRYLLRRPQKLEVWRKLLVGCRGYEATSQWTERHQTRPIPVERSKL